MSFSVLMSVYVKENPFLLDYSLFSIWDQQSYKPGQIVLVKDGELTPELDFIIAQWQENLGEMMTLVVLPENIGLGAALNEGLKFCKYELVARMDTDDISLTDRFEKQVAFMKARPEVAVCSGVIEEVDEAGIFIAHRILPLEHSELVRFAGTRCPISHPAAMFRKKAVFAVGCYPDFYPEDYLLWIKLIQADYKIANLPDVLVKMRTGHDFYTRRGWRFLKGEVGVYRHMHRTQFIGLFQFTVVVLMKTVLRLSPVFLKALMYKLAR